MWQKDFMESYLEGWVFILSLVAMIAFTVTFRSLLLERSLSVASTITRVVPLAYVLAIGLALTTPRSISGRASTPVWFPVTFRCLLGLSCAGLITLIFRRGATVHQRWIGLLITLVIGWLVYASIQHGNLTMNDWRMVGW
jgi:hypothetical protein